MAVVRTATQNIYGRRLWGRSAPRVWVTDAPGRLPEPRRRPGAGPGQRPCTHRDSHLNRGRADQQPAWERFPERSVGSLPDRLAIAHEPDRAPPDNPET